MREAKNHNKIVVLPLRNEEGKINETQKVHGLATINMTMMEAMIHSKMGVPSSINGAGQSGEK